MTEGHKDKDGKFHPHENSRKSISMDAVKSGGSYDVEQADAEELRKIKSKFTKTQKELVEKLKNNDVLTESDIRYMQNTLNGTYSDKKNSDFLTLIRMYSDGKPLRITEAQTTKGLDWLKKPKIQKDYLGTREKNILDNFKEFRLVDFTDISTNMNSYFVPIYEVISKSGDSFSYHITGAGSTSSLEIDG